MNHHFYFAKHINSDLTTELRSSKYEKELLLVHRFKTTFNSPVKQPPDRKCPLTRYDSWLRQKTAERSTKSVIRAGQRRKPNWTALETKEHEPKFATWERRIVDQLLKTNSFSRLRRIMR